MIDWARIEGFDCCTDAGRPLHVTFTLRRDDTMIRVISARSMHRRERQRYEQES